MEYVSNPSPGDCFLCLSLEEPDDAGRLVLVRKGQAFAILNKYPYNTGHVMVAPIVHKGELGDLSESERLDVWNMVDRVIDALRVELDPHGFNLGINLGRAAGAGLVGHVHIHVVPRWPGDTNFMPVVGHTKVMPESLEDTYRRLKTRF